MQVLEEYKIFRLWRGLVLMLSALNWDVGTRITALSVLKIIA